MHAASTISLSAQAADDYHSEVQTRRHERLTLETRVLLLLWFILHVISVLGLATKALPLLWTSSTTPASWPFLQALAFTLVLAADLTHALATLTDMAAHSRQLSDAQLTDRALLTATLLAPWLGTLDNALIYRWGAGSLAQSSPAWFAHFMFLVPMVARMPPAHTVLQFLLVVPFQLFNDFQTRCHNPSTHPELCLGLAPAPANLTEAFCTHPPASCCSSASFASYMSLQGPLLLAAGLLAAIIPIATYIQFPPTPPGPLQDDSPPPSPLPFQTLPIPLLVRLGRFPLLQQIEPWATGLMDRFHIDSHVLSVIIMTPLVFYYSGFSVLARHGLVTFAEVKPDVWILVLCGSVAVGRSSNYLETTSILRYLQGRMCRSVDVLTDVFPDHVVRHLLSDHPGMVDVSSFSIPYVPSSSGSQADLQEASAEEPPSPGPEPSQPPLVPADHLDLIARSRGPSARFLHILQAPHVHAAASADQHSPAFRPHDEPLDTEALLSSYSSFTVSTPGRSKRVTSASGSSQPRLSPRLCTIPDLHGMAQSHDCVTVLFSDLCGFSTWASKLPPAQVMHTLNDLFTRLDNIIQYELPTLYKVETIGDAYVVAANLCTPDLDHAATAVRFALRAQQEAAKVPRPDRDDGSTLQMRIGLNSGPIMSGVVGTLRRRFCMFGDTVNMGARTETSCPVGGVQLTAATYELAAPSLGGEVLLVERGEVAVKGSEHPIKMYLAMHPEFEGFRTPTEWMPLSLSGDAELGSGDGHAQVPARTWCQADVQSGVQLRCR